MDRNLSTLRDEARLQLHLASMDLQIWRHGLEHRVRRLAARVRGRVSAVGGAIVDLRDRFIVR